MTEMQNLTNWAQARQQASNRALRRAVAEKRARQTVARRTVEPDTTSPLNALLRELANRNIRAITKETPDA